MANDNAQDFLDKLTALKDIASFQGGFVTKEQITEAFGLLDDGKYALIEEYLRGSHIGIDTPINSDEFLDAEDKNYLQMYLDELEEIEDISESLKKVLLMEAVNKNYSQKDRLINAYLKPIVDIAKLYAGQGVSIEDLIGEGNVALVMTVGMLDCVDTAEDADALIIKQVMNAMEEFICEEVELSDVQKKSLDLVVKVTNKARALNEELLRKVTVDELAKETNLSKKKILEAIRISDGCLEYIEAPEDNDE